MLQFVTKILFGNVVTNVLLRENLIELKVGSKNNSLIAIY